MDPLRQFFEELALSWDESQPPERDQNLNQLLTQFDPIFSECLSILEVGTGTGALISVLNHRYPMAHLTSIDLAHNMLMRAQKRSAEADLIQCDVHFLPFSKSPFDAVVCHNSFPHFWQKPQAILSLKRVLKRNGHLLILHDLSRESVNDIHSTAQNPIIHQDLLPEGIDLAALLKSAHISPLIVEDTNNHYIVYAKLRGN